MFLKSADDFTVPTVTDFISSVPPLYFQLRLRRSLRGLRHGYFNVLFLLYNVLREQQENDTT